MMNQPESPDNKRVTIEELLRVKRAERPPQEFWVNFERDLRAKQLAAIVEPTPWWIKLRLPQFARTVVRYQMPVGAAAALVLSFVAVREYPSTYVATDSGVTLPTDRMIVESPAVASVADSVSVNTRDVVVAEAVQSQNEIATATSVNVAPETVPAGPGALLSMIPWAAPQQAVSSQVASTESEIGELSQVYFASAIKPTREKRFEGSVEVAPVLVSASVQQASSVSEVEGAAQAKPTSAREVRRSHILSSLVVAGNSPDVDRAVLAQSREVVASSLTNDRLYDSVSRLGMGGDRLTLKF
jgi:hypothetical protein